MDTLAGPETEDASRRIASLRRGLEGILGVPATEGNSIDVLHNGDEIFPAMLGSIGAAQRTIDLLTFVYWRSRIGARFAEALSERARAGVRVRVLLDAWGAQSIEKRLLRQKADAGVQVHWFRPVARLQAHKANHRTHRKVLVVDEEAAFTGGVGIAGEWEGDARNEREWRDTHFCIHGPAVDGLRAAFLNNWVETDDVLFESSIDVFPDQPQPGSAIIQVVRGAPTSGWSDISTLFRVLLQEARQRVRITTAYFVPDARLSDQLCSAAERGVTLEILLPGPHMDKRFVQLAGEPSYRTLLEHDVKIWHFQPSMLHAKIMTVDGLAAMIGSANLNARSTRLDDEIDLVVLQPELVAVLDAHFEEDLARSERIVGRRWKHRPAAQRASEAFAGLLRREV